MPKVRLLAPREIDGQPQAAGAEVDVSEEEAAALKAAGAVSFVEDEKKAEAAANEGNFSARTSRADAGQAEAEDKPKKGKT